MTRRRSALLRLLVGAPWLCVGCAGYPSADRVQSEIAEISHAHEPRVVAIAYRDLKTGRTAVVKGDVVVHAASTMKVPVMIELFRQADAGERAMEDPVRVTNEFASIVDGSPYQLTPEDDSDRELYHRIGSEMTIRALTDRMITKSSNLATNILIQLADAERVQSTIESLWTTKMRVLRGVEDTLAYRAGRSNTATARDLMEVLTAIARGTAASSAACEEMIEVLAAQEFNDLIPAGLPRGTRVAHKTGWITGILHDAAIVYPRSENGPPFVLVVLTKGFEDRKAAAAVIADVARSVHAAREGS